MVPLRWTCSSTFGTDVISRSVARSAIGLAFLIGFDDGEIAHDHLGASDIRRAGGSMTCRNRRICNP